MNGNLVESICPYCLLLFITVFGVGTLAQSTLECYVCEGSFPDRDCELFPRYVTIGPGKMNCSTKFCLTTVYFKPKKHLLTPALADGEPPGSMKPLTADDYDVDEVVRSCGKYPDTNGAKCHESHDDPLGVTCYGACYTDLCNNEILPLNLQGVSKAPSTVTTTQATTTTTESQRYEMEPDMEDYEYDEDTSSFITDDETINSTASVIYDYESEQETKRPEVDSGSDQSRGVSLLLTTTISIVYGYIAHLVY